jgi:hypothetical protein
MLQWILDWASAEGIICLPNFALYERRLRVRELSQRIELRSISGHGMSALPSLDSFLSACICRRCSDNFNISRLQVLEWPITVAARSKAWTVFARLNPVIMGSKPTQDMDICVCVYTVFVFFVLAEALQRADPPVQSVLPVTCRINILKKRPRAIDR